MHILHGHLWGGRFQMSGIGERQSSGGTNSRESSGLRQKPKDFAATGGEVNSEVAIEKPFTTLHSFRKPMPAHLILPLLCPRVSRGFVRPLSLSIPPDSVLCVHYIGVF